MTACSPAHNETELPPYLQRFPTSPEFWSHRPCNLSAETFHLLCHAYRFHHS